MSLQYRQHNRKQNPNLGGIETAGFRTWATANPYVKATANMGAMIAYFFRPTGFNLFTFSKIAYSALLTLLHSYIVYSSFKYIYMS